MLKIQFTGEHIREYRPVFVCDCCLQPIVGLENGVVMFPNRTEEDGDQPLDECHCHYGRCFDEGERLCRRNERGVAWYSLDDHIREIANCLQGLGNPNFVLEEEEIEA